MSDQGMREAIERAEARRLKAIDLAGRDVHQENIEVLEDVGVDYRDGGYWVAARIWVDAESVEHGCGFDIPLASDFVADADGRDARFTRTDDGENDPKPPVERPAAVLTMEPWELDAVAGMVDQAMRSPTLGEPHRWIGQRILDKQVRNWLGKA